MFFVWEKGKTGVYDVKVIEEIWHGDCLELMKDIPDGSVDMILCDPPYGTVKNIGDSELVQHGMKGKTGWDKIIDTKKLFNEYNRILRMNGCLIMFSQEPYTSKIITESHGNIPFSYRMIWKKDHFANSLIAKVAPVSYYEDIVVFFKKYDTGNNHPVRRYAKKLFDYIGKDKKEIFKIMGHQGTCHFMRHESMQFGLCTEKTYKELCSLFDINDLDWFIPFLDLQRMNNAFNRRFNRRFNLYDGNKFKSNVLSFKKDYRGEHPTQKPVALFEDLIKTYTNKGDTVLDNCAGSGTTGVAARNLNRNFILIEKEKEYVDIINSRLAK